MTETLHTKAVEPEEPSFFPSRQGDIPFWDHPLFGGHRHVPDKYRPYTTIERVLQSYEQAYIDETDIRIIKVLADAMCANENQMRRYLSRFMSAAETSKRLNRLRNRGFVERWKCRIASDEKEEIKPPAPYTVGIAGYHLLNQLYPSTKQMDPRSWYQQSVLMIQRYVAMNELRCLFAEQRVLQNWGWNVMVDYNQKVRKPLGVAELKTPKGTMTLMIERPQMAQNFVSFLKTKLNQWERVYENRSNSFLLKGMENDHVVVVLYASTYQMAEHIQEILVLENYPFRIWFCIEEAIEQDGLSYAFHVPDDEAIKQLHIPFLDT